MITKFLSNTININILTILITYLIFFLIYDESTTILEVLLLMLLLTVNNILMYMRGMARVIRDEFYENDSQQ